MGIWPVTAEKLNERINVVNSFILAKSEESPFLATLGNVSLILALNITSFRDKGTKQELSPSLLISQSKKGRDLVSIRALACGQAVVQ